MLKNPLKQPVTRDTTTNPAGEILGRLAAALLYLSAGLAPTFALLAFAQRDETRLRGAYACAALFVVLFATRRRWRPAPAVPAPETAPSADVSPSADAAAPVRRPRVLLLDASLAGPDGNSARLLSLLAPRLAPRAELDHAALSGPAAVTFADLEPALRAADAIVFATGTHWDSWSSPLQKFLEDATPAEASALWLGKPAAVLVTEHSTGGKAVLSRLQGVLVTLGCTLPPLSGLVLSQAAQLARRHAPDPDAAADFWSPADLDVIARNLLLAAGQPRAPWQTWPVDRRDFARVWLDAK